MDNITKPIKISQQAGVDNNKNISPDEVWLKIIERI